MGGIYVNDRAVCMLENYEIEVSRTWKGRGAILCESDKGLLILKEYSGPKDKIYFQDALLNSISGRGFEMVESILRAKDGELIVYDQDRTSYILKTYFEGRECNVRDTKECLQVVKTLARLHNASEVPLVQEPGTKPEFYIDREYEKHNKELRKVRKYLRDKSQKTNFEIYLLKHYDYFYAIALRAAEEMRDYLKEALQEQQASNIVCHGDYQYHNILITKNSEMAIINFEKCIIDNPVRDLYLFMRKLLEKSSWSIELGTALLDAYSGERRMTEQDFVQLYYRFTYPEKFWKIVNFYFNSGKAWIPGRNMEKLQKLLEQEGDKVKFLENYKNTYGRFSFLQH